MESGEKMGHEYHGVMTDVELGSTLHKGKGRGRGYHVVIGVVVLGRGRGRRLAETEVGWVDNVAS